MTDYKVVNITPDTYAKVSQIADKNGFSLGQQVKVWADEAMPKCGHPLQAVTVQTFPAPVEHGQVDIHYRTAFYCPKCKRVYAEL